MHTDFNVLFEGTKKTSGTSGKGGKAAPKKSSTAVSFEWYTVYVEFLQGFNFVKLWLCKIFAVLTFMNS